MCIFFFKQKTAYEMRISDWSSDVCSSDLSAGGQPMTRPRRLWLLPVSIIAALLLGLLPLPPLVQPLRPYWLALVVAFWVIEEPDRAGLGFAFAMGVIGDLAFGG